MMVEAESLGVGWQTAGREGNTEWRGDDKPFSCCFYGPKKACIFRNLYFLVEVFSILDLLETKSSSLLMLHWGSVSVTFIIQSVWWDFVERILVFWGWM
jgi:hypothetical protein